MHGGRALVARHDVHFSAVDTEELAASIKDDAPPLVNASTSAPLDTRLLAIFKLFSMHALCSLHQARSSVVHTCYPPPPSQCCHLTAHFAPPSHVQGHSSGHGTAVESRWFCAWIEIMVMTAIRLEAT